MGNVIGVLIFALAVWFIWDTYIAADYSKPWWTGNEYQKVCATTGLEACYDLIVFSDGEGIDAISMPSGAIIYANDSECVKASQLKDSRLCRMWEPSGTKWDIMKP